jgi:hypothetical protein
VSENEVWVGAEVATTAATSAAAVPAAADDDLPLLE